MRLTHTRLVSMMSQGRLFLTTHTAIVSLADLGLGDTTCHSIDKPIDISGPRPASFRHEGGGIELLNGELVSDWTNHFHPEQQVFMDVIDINSLTDLQETTVRFWHNECSWCQYKKTSRHDDKTPSWQDVVANIVKDSQLEKTLAKVLFGRKKLLLKHIRMLCANQISKPSISDHRKKITPGLTG